MFPLRVRFACWRNAPRTRDGSYFMLLFSYWPALRVFTRMACMATNLCKITIFMLN